MHTIGNTGRSISRMAKTRVSLSLSPDAAAALARAGADNQSGYVERLIMADAVASSVASHGDWFRQHPGFAEQQATELEAAA